MSSDHAISLALHGGAGEIPAAAHDYAEHRAALHDIASTTRAALLDGMSALDAVEQSVRALEDCPLFNAGHGAVLNAAGEAELDASIMAGDGRAGAVAGARLPRNPIQLARAVLADGQHVTLCGAGADAACRDWSVATAAPDYFITDLRRQQLDRARTGARVVLDHDEPLGTVGAVARDRQGRLAAATSTGGMTNKRVGRVGDSAQIGAGTWAHDETCAVSTTGHGESFIRINAAAQVHWRMRLSGASLDAATDAVIRQVVDVGGMGGLIAVDHTGQIALPMSSSGMFRAWCALDGPVHAAVFKFDDP